MQLVIFLLLRGVLVPLRPFELKYMWKFHPVTQILLPTEAFNSYVIPHFGHKRQRRCDAVANPSG